MRVCLTVPFVMAGALLASCGGSTTSSPSAVPSSPAAPAQGSASSVDAVALAGSTRIPKASYEHWLAVEKADGAGNADHRALGFLITSQWVLSEAAARGISVSDAEVKRHFTQIAKQSFPKAGSLQKFLAKSRQTEADLLARIKVELLTSHIAAKVTAGKSGSQSTAVLTSFEKSFQQHWKSYTTCKASYVMEDCSEYKGKPENLMAPNSSSSSSSPRSGSKSSSSSASNSSNSSGELPPPSAAAMAITSSAFERNGAIPSQYTCDGSNISPPLEWQNVPKNAAALVLIMIDNSSTGPASGIRWFVGDINPSSKGVAAGKIPEGGIVGSDTQGKRGYGGICPPHGKTSTIQFVLYALSKKIPLTPGFTPAIAESEYGAGKLLLGQSAVTYAGYHRP
jgi:Raf kinase inhibitor-like YbhB/YbcL family protein